jgi:hypothetical protein
MSKLCSVEESLSTARDLMGDPHGTADSLITLSRAAMKLGRLTRRTLGTGGLEISRATNDRWV